MVFTNCFLLWIASYGRHFIDVMSCFIIWNNFQAPRTLIARRFEVIWETTCYDECLRLGLEKEMFWEINFHRKKKQLILTNVVKKRFFYRNHSTNLPINWQSCKVSLTKQKKELTVNNLKSRREKEVNINLAVSIAKLLLYQLLSLAGDRYSVIKTQKKKKFKLMLFFRCL